MSKDLEVMKPVIAGALSGSDMDRHAIKSRALRHGFTLRPQEGRPDDLNEYVYSFAREVFEAGRKVGEKDRDALTSELDKAYQREVIYGQSITNHILAMSAAVIEWATGNRDAAIQWIGNTLDGPGLYPDVEAAQKLGGAQAWFNHENQGEMDRLLGLTTGSEVGERIKTAILTYLDGKEATRECDALTAELERERLRLAACGVVAMADTPDSAREAREMHPDYKSASCDDVARRVAECMALRQERDALAAELERLRAQEQADEISTNREVAKLRRLMTRIQGCFRHLLLGSHAFRRYSPKTQRQVEELHAAISEIKLAAHKPAEPVNARLLEALKKQISNNEQAAFEEWLSSESPSGDVESVQRQWEESSAFRVFLELTAEARAALAAAEAQQAEPVQSAFPERDTSKPAEEQGMFRKFEVHRVDGSDRTGGKHHGCRYFVLDLDHDQHAPAAMAAYAKACRATHPVLSAELSAEYLPHAVDKAWARFCGAFGDGPDAPYPGMIAAFETHYGQSFRDREWRSEAACWAAAWQKATEQAAKTQEARRAGIES